MLNSTRNTAPWYAASAPIGLERKGLFTDINNQRHAANRRKVASLYSMTTMLKWEHYTDESTRVLISKFKKHAQSAECINLQLWLQYFAFDTISLITLGKSFGFVENGRDEHGFLDAIHIYLVYCANVGVYSEFHPILGWLAAKLPSGGISWMVGFVQQLCQNRFKEVGPDKFASAPERDFLGTILRMHGQNLDKILLEDVTSHSLTNIGAGSDTTSVSLASIMYHLITSPDSLKRVRQEIDEAAERGQLSELITFAEAQKLPFL
ncbi:uncharacterized protein Z518_06450 [Rhinocladiella mackenziei CBS 650.93]|uniref:Rhinocladiella mackenziei CBS 650.93 unplaced genomic scaffold supercont1.4, whole genome shotgun sequence n=1 Tax=Rhinocladiella mackenziei CBS 650.93 TaxID=1442369 RepID=A0A0D2H5A2_9EURO|nr:uncharacterized protein Z518_06450 [Rhinocladiella mackenziei CBS 650.93]KIX05578.1 hypothetical protein Z518_06450 [Rhinocladiella mackenziei CBS 650.93]